MTRIKICGLTDIQAALAASEVGADFLGLVFASSRRQVTPEKALSIVEAVHRGNYRPMVTGVFVNMPFAEVNHVAEYCHLDYLQLSGDESWDYCLNLRRPIIKVIHMNAGNLSQSIVSDIETGFEKLSKNFICLLDAPSGETYGGTGRTFDWQMAKEITKRFPILIAGGLTPENVGILIKEVKPWGVDVSSGIETNGKKDVNKIKAFIREVRNNSNLKTQRLKPQLKG